jgi:hypothetical protein
VEERARGVERRVQVTVAAAEALRVAVREKV